MRRKSRGAGSCSAGGGERRGVMKVVDWRSWRRTKRDWFVALHHRWRVTRLIPATADTRTFTISIALTHQSQLSTNCNCVLNICASSSLVRLVVQIQPNRPTNEDEPLCHPDYLYVTCLWRAEQNIQGIKQTKCVSLQQCKIVTLYTEERQQAAFNSWPTFSPYLYNRV